jgi:hypothetical protein
MRILGRSALIDDLVAHACAGHAVLAYGPRGIGASTVLDGCATALERKRRRVVRIARVASYANLIEPIMRAYAGASRASNERVRAALEAAPGAVLVDRVERAGPKVRREIRELGAIGLGAIFVGQVDAPREHAALRALRLAHRELLIPRLDRGAMNAVFDANLPRELGARLVEADRERALRAADGRPGLLVLLAGALAQPRYWRDGRAAVDLALADLAIADVTGMSIGRT